LWEQLGAVLPAPKNGDLQYNGHIYRENE